MDFNSRNGIVEYLYLTMENIAYIMNDNRRMLTADEKKKLDNISSALNIAIENINNRE